MAGLYVHVPFRRGAHAYDDRSAVEVDTADEDQYVAALCRELRLYGDPYFAEAPLRTLYLGGGRPSLLSTEALRRFFTALRETVDVSALAEITMEVNPADARPDYVEALAQMGVDRVSLDALSFSAADLRAVDAPHTAEDVTRALRRARRTGLETLSADLLFGWPDQSHADWAAALDRAVALNLPHVTLLEVPPTTGAVADDETLAHRLEHAMSILRAEGYEQYELTHFARAGARSRHQTNYYAHGNQVGLGPSSESFWWPRRPDRGRARRWTNVADLDRYLTLLRDRFPPVADRQTLDRTALAQEYVMLQLRTADGLNLNHLAAQYGVDLSSDRGALLDRLKAEGLVRMPDHTVRLTTRGRLLTDAITEKLMPTR